MKQFRTPEKCFGNLGAETAARVVAAASDIALIVDADGRISDLSFDGAGMGQEGVEGWVGRLWIDTATPETQPKIKALLKAADDREPGRARHVNHPSPKGPDLPVMYSTMRLEQGCILALGRDLRPMAVLQQRLVDAQQAMERDYSRFRQMETRYRLVFQTTKEPVLVADAASQKIVEANPAATELFAPGQQRLIGRTFPQGFDLKSSEAVQTLLDRVSAAGESENVRATMADGKRSFEVAAILFRQEESPLFLIRLSEFEGSGSGGRAPTWLAEAARRAPDAICVTGPDGRVLQANDAFVSLAQISSLEQAKGMSLDSWLGRPGVDFNVLMANLREHGAVRLFATSFHGEHGSETEVEISATAFDSGHRETAFGFTIRNVDRRLSANTRIGQELPHGGAQVTDLVGRQPLKEIVRQTADAIEQLCIQTALDLTGDNRASAAEILGLSRQSLYVKLRRYGIDESPGGVEP